MLVCSTTHRHVASIAMAGIDVWKLDLWCTKK